jgi:hypothetical protein
MCSTQFLVLQIFSPQIPLFADRGGPLWVGSKSKIRDQVEKDRLTVV